MKSTYRKTTHPDDLFRPNQVPPARRSNPHNMSGSVCPAASTWSLNERRNRACSVGRLRNSSRFAARILWDKPRGFGFHGGGQQERLRLTMRNRDVRWKRFRCTSRNVCCEHVWFVDQTGDDNRWYSEHPRWGAYTFAPLQLFAFR